jgi:hypothetical protein
VALPARDVPVPPVPTEPAAASVPASNGAGASVPVPSQPAAGAVSGITFAQLVTELTQATHSGRLTTEAVQTLLQSCGAPNLAALRGMPQLFADVKASLDAKLAGL